MLEILQSADEPDSLGREFGNVLQAEARKAWAMLNDCCNHRVAKVLVCEMNLERLQRFSLSSEEPNPALLTDQIGPVDGKVRKRKVPCHEIVHDVVVEMNAIPELEESQLLADGETTNEILLRKLSSVINPKFFCRWLKE
jgi:hypothetical protein